MFLSAFHYDGDPARLVPAYDTMREGFPEDAFELHVCVVTSTGITVFDACPSREVFEEFSRSPQFLDAAAAAGLPASRIEPLGEIHYAVAGTSVTT